jgi:Tol biopolymer transport system component
VPALLAKDEYPRLTRAIALLTVLLVTTTGVACGGADSDDAPEGRIAFATELDAGWRVAVANADGSGDLAVLRHPSDYQTRDATWSPDGRKIAAVDDEGVWMINADGTGLREVAADLDLSSLVSFAWAPDGSQVVFHHRSGLYVEDADGANRRRIVRCDCPPDTQVAWSPDGTTIAYSEWADPGTQIHLVNPDGTGKRVLTKGGQGAELSWSPDGEQIAFTRPPDVTERPIMYVINSDGSGEVRLVTGEGPVWSPAGDRIAFMYGGDVHVINSDGSGERKLASGDYPSWSPSGTEIAVSRGGRAIWVLNLNGSRGRQIWPRHGRCECGAPTWLPD